MVNIAWDRCGALICCQHQGACDLLIPVLIIHKSSGERSLQYILFQMNNRVDPVATNFIPTDCFPFLSGSGNLHTHLPLFILHLYHQNNVGIHLTHQMASYHVNIVGLAFYFLRDDHAVHERLTSLLHIGRFHVPMLNNDSTPRASLNVKKSKSVNRHQVKRHRQNKSVDNLV